MIMTTFSKSVKCKECGADLSLTFTTDLITSDFSLSAKCPKCGHQLELHFCLVSEIQAEPKEPQQLEIDENLMSETFSPMESSILNDIIEK